MRIPSRTAFLSELDSLGEGARLARAARLGLAGRGQPDLVPLMDALLSGSPYEGRLALEIARSAGHEPVLLRGLTLASCLVRGRAASLAASTVRDEAALERLLPELAFFVRRRLLKGVVKARRGALAARLFPQVLARHGAEEAALLLPALDASTLRARLPELAHTVRNWRPLVHRDPEGVLDFLRTRLTEAPERERRSLFVLFGAPLSELTLSRGEAVLELVRTLAPPEELPHCIRIALPHLLRHHPAATATLLLRPAWRDALQREWIAPGARRELRFLSPEDRLALARALADAPSRLAEYLEVFAPSARRALFLHAYEGVAPRVHPPELLAALPHATRDDEAARQLELREVREDKDQRLTVQALRLIEHAREPLNQAAQASKAEERARALSLLVSCTGQSRRGVEETLEALARRKNEQDPVRCAALTALSQVPPSLFTPAHVPALQRLVTDAVEARDMSMGTQMAVQQLAFRQMRAHATHPEHPLFRFALETLQWLAARSGTLVLPPMERDLPRGAEHLLVAALLPLLRAANQRESHSLTLALARSLGRRAWNVEPLQALLATITDALPHHAQEACALWLASPRTRDARVRHLLDRDKSTVTLPLVFEHLHRRRQEWLDPFIQGHVLKGRFSTGKTGWVPAVRDGFGRWLPRQQQLFLHLLSRIARDTQRSAWERMSVVRVMPRLQEADLSTLTPYLSTKDVPLVEAALGALVWLDRPEPALPLLLEHLDSDRARVAMYALPRLARRVAPQTFATTLGELLSRERLKVTVAKEALRLLGTVRSASSLPLLRQQWERPTLHRDVRIAVGHAARQLLDQSGAWELLEALAQSPDADVAASLLDPSPLTLPLAQRPHYARLLLRVSRHSEPTVRRRALTTLANWAAGLEEEVARETSQRVLDLAQGEEWREALGTLVEVTREGRGFEQVESGVERLVSAAATFDATPERDRPERQRLVALSQRLQGLPRSVRRRLRPRLDAVARGVAKEPTLWPESAALRLSGQGWEDTVGAAGLLRALADEVREEPCFLPVLSARVDAALEEASSEWTPEGLLDLATRVEDVAPLLAVRLVAHAGKRVYWREDTARALRALRQHPRLSVRAAALDVLTANE
jgi:hypothetical protein